MNDHSFYLHAQGQDWVGMKLVWDHIQRPTDGLSGHVDVISRLKIDLVQGCYHEKSAFKSCQLTVHAVFVVV